MTPSEWPQFWECLRSRAQAAGLTLVQEPEGPKLYRGGIPLELDPQRLAQQATGIPPPQWVPLIDNALGQPQAGFLGKYRRWIGLLIPMGLIFLVASEAFDFADFRHASEGTPISKINDVLLEVEGNPEANVFSLIDGQVLGRTPMRFLVAPDTHPEVVVLEEGFFPLKVRLPSTGQTKVKLKALPEDVGACAIPLPKAGRSSFIPEGGTIEDDKIIVPGSALLRIFGEVNAAWIITCPDLGGDNEINLVPPERKPVTIEISNPIGAKVYTSEEFMGAAPVSLQRLSGFYLLQVEGVYRWVPALGDVTISFPIFAEPS